MIEVTEEERQRAIMRSRQKYETDLISDVLTVQSCGWKEGFVERMSIMGFSESDIARATDLSEQNIKDILTGVTKEERKREIAHLKSQVTHETGAREEISRVLTAYGEDNLKRTKKEMIYHMYEKGFDIANIAKAFILPEQEVKDILGQS